MRLPGFWRTGHSRVRLEWREGTTERGCGPTGEMNRRWRLIWCGLGAQRAAPLHGKIGIDSWRFGLDGGRVESTPRDLGSDRGYRVAIQRGAFVALIRREVNEV